MSCPMRARDADVEFRPFCSKRCADADLGRWMTGAYAVPSQEPEDIDAAIDAIDQQNAKPH